MKKHVAAVVLIFILTLALCTKKQVVPENAVMARIGDRVITINEFIERAEYTIRPVYAKQNLYIHKKIILNSLVVEKLMAIEAGDSSVLLQSEKFNLFIQGRKEQIMRQLFFQKNMYDKVKYDEKEMEKVYELAGRTYDIQFASVDDEKFAEHLIKEVIDNKRDFAEVVLESTGEDSMPHRQVKFDMNEIDKVRQALYEHDVKKGDVIGPIRMDDQNLFIKVMGWRELVAMSPQDIQNRWTDAKQHISFKYAGEMYNDYVLDLMRGKKVDFDRDTFVAFVNILGPLYFQTKETKEADVQQNMFGGNASQEGLPDSLQKQLHELEDRPLLICDGETWTVEELGRELALHPLQFRKRKFRRGEFGNQVKLAIVDLIRDKYITEDAYKQKIDQLFIVKAKEQMWRDAYLAAYLRDEKLAEMGVLQEFKDNYLRLLETNMNPYVDSLQAKYSDIVEINTDALEQVKLTRIDLMAMYTNQPYPVVVPGFPILTTDTKLEYGKKLGSDNIKKQ